MVNSLMSKSKFFGAGETAALKDCLVHFTWSLEYPSLFATAYATADSNPLPLAGLLSENQGSYAGLSVAMVRTPEVCVLSESGLQPAMPCGDAADELPEAAAAGLDATGAL